MRLLKNQLFLIIFILGIGVSRFSFAQTAPQFIVSWRANDFTPAGFIGKLFPAKNTGLDISFDLIDGGKLIDLTQNKISWFLNENRIQSGFGLKVIHFLSQNLDQQIRITVANYKGSDLDEVLTIPVVQPEVVIDSHSPSKQISAVNRQFQAFPYFFNINNLSDLAFNWLFNGSKLEEAVDHPELFNLNLQSQGTPVATDLQLSVTAVSSLNPLETATKNLVLTVQ